MIPMLIGSQWLIKTLLVFSLLLLAYGIIRPVRSAQHLAMRRLGMLFFIAIAAISAIFPQLVTLVAQYVGIGRGADLLLYGLTIAFFSTLATSYRKDAATERKLTKIARTIALKNVRHKDEN